MYFCLSFHSESTKFFNILIDHLCLLFLFASLPVWGCLQQRKPGNVTVLCVHLLLYHLSGSSTWPKWRFRVLFGRPEVMCRFPLMHICWYDLNIQLTWNNQLGCEGHRRSVAGTSPSFFFFFILPWWKTKYQSKLFYCIISFLSLYIHLFIVTSILWEFNASTKSMPSSWLWNSCDLLWVGTWGEVLMLELKSPVLGTGKWLEPDWTEPIRTGPPVRTDLIRQSCSPKFQLNLEFFFIPIEQKLAEI